MGTILLVEDHDDFRDVAATILREEGYNVVEAQHGRHALELLETLKQPPCLVLLDMLMPVMDGYQFLEALKDSDRLAGLPVVALSAWPPAMKVKDALGVLLKPVTTDALLEVAREHCGSN